MFLLPGSIDQGTITSLKTDVFVLISVSKSRDKPGCPLLIS